MSDIEKIRQYIERSGISPATKSKYQMPLSKRR